MSRGCNRHSLARPETRLASFTPPLAPFRYINSFVADADGGMSLVEASYVHQVYSRLATYASKHPSQQVWPQIRRFLDDTAPGSLLLDVGCGRARHTADHCVTFGVDTCPDMILKMDRHVQMQPVLANALSLPFRNESVDRVFCVSVLHHVSTLERRRQAVQEVFRVLRPGGQAVFLVWAFEQPNGVFKGQDVLVPFNLHEIPKSGQLPLIKFHKDSTKEQRVINNSIPIQIPEESCPKWFKAVFGTKMWTWLPGRQSMPPAIPMYLQRLSLDNVQHLFVSGIHRWSPALGKKLVNVQVEELLAREMTAHIFEEAYAEAMSTLRAVSYYRYYHLFRRGELQELLRGIPDVSVVDCVYESANWCLIAQKRGQLGVHDIAI